MLEIVLAVFILIAFITDVRRSQIPNVLTVSAVLIGLLLQGIIGGWDGLLQGLIGMGVGLAVMLPLYLFGALGAGDVKLFAGIGAITSLSYVMNSMLYSLLFAGLIGVVILIWRKQVRQKASMLFSVIGITFIHRDLQAVRTVRNSKNITFPFMYAVLPGSILAMLEGFW
ncbi:prepilin peptidase [Paenibacillus sp. N1-5-1-14]|uniref:A24 family peptidase n=1 Tax=Paenibacillus radicibacter TaxID=2972488 RepID=UPI0021592ECE|nr:prepilin peptidase [Paenibacillus radicibacter]MCR8641359.1 prepilin peptidase [Paenibacillus radicibacter]